MSALSRLLTWGVVTLAFASATFAEMETDAVQIGRFHEEALTDASVYSNLKELTTRFPARLAGSKNLEGAVVWAEQQLRDAGCDTVRLQPVDVPHWERGAAESFALLPAKEQTGSPEPLTGLALGWSESTPAEGLRASVIEVQSLD